MARVGLLYSVFAPIVTETPASAIVYGSPFVFDHPIEANVAYEVSDNPLYGGDVIAENDNSIVGGTLAFNNTHLTPADRAGLLGHLKEGTSPNDFYEETSASSPAGGFGYITPEIENGVKKWYGFWIHKTQLAMAEDQAASSAKSKEWKTPALSGPIMGVSIDDTGRIKFRRYKLFTTLAEAKSWVNGLAGVNAASVATPTASPDAGAVAAATQVELLTETTGAAIYYTLDGSSPTTGSMVYAVKIKIYGPVTIKAMAVKAGMNNSGILTAAYTIS